MSDNMDNSSNSEQSQMSDNCRFCGIELNKDNRVRSTYKTCTDCSTKRKSLKENLDQI